ncbi:MAG TPA: pitrilysin family protein [Longimicrobium sp.]|uniref:M16 family metallopeptidase n=1 Tax=Longimicrobium sp. TaxID=2029185 RepID=UPI002EDAFC3C
MRSPHCGLNRWSRPATAAAAATLLSFAPATAGAQPGPPMGGADGLHVEFMEDSLPNGLRVLYHVDRSTPAVAVNVWYRVGARDEEPGRTGFAHLFEHVMFKGSRNVADGEHWGLLERAGARGGADVNGTTGHERTNYFQTVPSNQLGLALWLEADRMGTLLETLTQEKLDNQREVVKNERRQGTESDPYGTWYELMLARVFPEGHPYHHSTIGSMDDLSAASLDDVRRFFRSYYTPDNAVLAIAGDFDVAEARRLVARYFGPIPRGGGRPALPPMSLPIPIGRAQRMTVPVTRTRAPAVFAGFRVPAQADPLGPAAVLLSMVLGEGEASPLYDRLVRGGERAVSASAWNIWMVDGADLATFSATGAPGANADSLARALEEVIPTLAAAITQQRLDAVRAGLRFQFLNGLQSLGGFGGRSDRLAEGYVYHGNANWVNERMRGFDAVTVEQLRRAAGEWLVPENRVTLVFDPAAPAAGGER